MHTKLLISIFGAGLLLIATGCGKGSSGATVNEAPSIAPDHIVQDFYTWFLEIGPEGEIRDYHESELLSEEAKQALESASFSASPIVCAQDLPDSVTAESASISGDQASVVVMSSFGNSITVNLKLVDGQWMISNFQCK